MTIDCQWVEKNLEALFCDKLSGKDNSLARAHINDCPSCRKEAQALDSIDPLIRRYFLRELDIAKRPRVLHKRRLFGLAGATGAVFVAVLLLLMYVPRTSRVVLPVPGAAGSGPAVSVEEPQPAKPNGVDEPVRAKPTVGINAPGDALPPVPSTIGANAPEFLVTDPAGYSHTLDDYRGHVVVIALWSAEQTESIANIERLYQTYGVNPKFRLLGVSSERQQKPANTTFPVLYNQGSKLFGAQPGDFVLLDENGSLQMRGSLVNDFDGLTKALRGK